MQNDKKAFLTSANILHSFVHEFIVPRLKMKKLGIPMDIEEIMKQELSPVAGGTTSSIA